MSNTNDSLQVFGYHPATEISYRDGKMRGLALKRLCPKVAGDAPIKEIYLSTPKSRLHFIRSAVGVKKKVSEAVEIVLEVIKSDNFRPIARALPVFIGIDPFKPKFALQGLFDPSASVRRILGNNYLKEDEIIDLLIFAGFGVFELRLLRRTI